VSKAAKEHERYDQTGQLGRVLDEIDGVCLFLPYNTGHEVLRRRSELRKTKKA
jgi:hypothetical protein